MNPLAFAPDESHPLVDALLATVPGPPVARAVHAGDDMLAFAVEREDGDFDRGLASYFADGLRVASALRQLAAARGGFERIGPVLDFASGYGRVTRFLASECAPASIWAAEIDPQAVAFQRQAFGVQAFDSSASPEALACGERFDLVFVSSLFTHLPEVAFRGWLQRLSQLLLPTGLLALTVHDVSVLDYDDPRRDQGFVFQPTSESRTLDPQIYGSAWVTERFVRGAVREADAGLAVRRIARGLGGYQDLYLLSRDPQPVLDALDFDPGPDGFLERAEVEAGRLRLSGWATERTPGRRLAWVRAWLDGRLAGESPAGGDRPDVAAMWGPCASRSGFAIEADLASRARHASTVLLLKAASDSGAETVLHIGTVESALLRSARKEVEAAGQEVYRREQAELEGRRLELRARRLALRVEELEARIAAMRRSRFWKLRDAWFAVKRTLGLTREP